MKDLLIALRPKQWIKNLFIFLPLLFGKKLFLFPVNARAVIAFLLFSLAASTAYLINDIIDKKRDENHPVNSLRPIASGKLSLKNAALAIAVLGTISIFFSFKLDSAFGLIVVMYLLFNLVYSTFLKDAVIIDVFCIAGFFILRIQAGGVIAQLQNSHWILVMTGLLALFLGFNKRRQELKLALNEEMPQREVLVKYNAYFIDQMIAVITSSIVVVYMLYTVDAQTVSAFGTKKLLLSIPFVYYGIFRYLYLIHKHKKYGDPTRLLLSDAKMQINLILWTLVCTTVIYY